ncbi:MAG: hypothetical protein ACE5PT_10660 [Gemmatimonadales bacterium]
MTIVSGLGGRVDKVGAPRTMRRPRARLIIVLAGVLMRGLRDGGAGSD